MTINITGCLKLLSMSFYLLSKLNWKNCLHWVEHAEQSSERKTNGKHWFHLHLYSIKQFTANTAFITTSWNCHIFIKKQKHTCTNIISSSGLLCNLYTVNTNSLWLIIIHEGVYINIHEGVYKLQFTGFSLSTIAVTAVAATATTATFSFGLTGLFSRIGPVYARSLMGQLQWVVIVQMPSCHLTNIIIS